MKIDNRIASVSLKETKEEYKAPVLETIEVRVERGFQQTRRITEPGATDDNEYTW